MFKAPDDVFLESAFSGRHPSTGPLPDPSSQTDRQTIFSSRAEERVFGAGLSALVYLTAWERPFDPLQTSVQ